LWQIKMAFIQKFIVHIIYPPTQDHDEGKPIIISTGNPLIPLFWKCIWHQLRSQAQLNWRKKRSTYSIFRFDVIINLYILLLVLWIIRVWSPQPLFNNLKIGNPTPSTHIRKWSVDFKARTMHHTLVHFSMYYLTLEI
jgi:hypothetical protein